MVDAALGLIAFHQPIEIGCHLLTHAVVGFLRFLPFHKKFLGLAAKAGFGRAVEASNGTDRQAGR
jgi:hypothetical protein